QHIQARPPAMLGRVRGELDPDHLEMARSLHEEESIGASQFEQLPATTIAADEIDAACEFAPQHGLGAEIVGISVGTAAGEIIPGVVGGGIETGCLGAAEAAVAALQNVAAVDPKAELVVGGAPACGAHTRQFSRVLRVCEMDRRMRVQRIGCHRELTRRACWDRVSSEEGCARLRLGKFRLRVQGSRCRMLTKVSCIGNEQTIGSAWSSCRRRYVRRSGDHLAGGYPK